jgi:hypothetical protein
VGTVVGSWASWTPPPIGEQCPRKRVNSKGQPEPGGKVRLTLRVTLTRAQADRLTVRAIAEGKNLDALVAEIVEAAPTEPTAWNSPKCLANRASGLVYGVVAHRVILRPEGA